MKKERNYTREKYVAPDITEITVKLDSSILLEGSSITIDQEFADGGDM